MNESWRVILALVLSLLVLVFWNMLFPTPEVPEEPEQEVERTEPEKVEPEPLEKAEPPEPEKQVEPKKPDELAELEYHPDQEEVVTVRTPLYKAVLNSQGGVLESFVLREYKQSIEPDAESIELVTPGAMEHAPLGLMLNRQRTWEEADWKIKGQDLNLEKGQEGQLVLQGEMNGYVLQRKFTFAGDSYRIQETLTVQNKSDRYLSGNLGLNLASKQLVANESRFNRTNVIHFDQDGLQEEHSTDSLQAGEIAHPNAYWGGIGSNYFLLAAVPVDETMSFQGGYDNDIYLVNMQSSLSVADNSANEFDYTYYFGPKQNDYLQGAPNNLHEALNYGWLDIIASPLVKTLNFFYGYVGNYGLAIIMLTFVIKILFWPLAHKSYKSMEKMKKIQPMMKELKEKYKDDRQKMNQEVMRLYKTYKVNPAGGCLPMLLQIPVFIGLYEALLGAVELRHASFIPNVPMTDIVWLADLSARDPLYVTPVLMGASMFLQQKMSPVSGDPTQAKIMMIMPVVLTFIFLTFPAGLVVYFITNNLLSMLQQWLVLRKA